MTASPIERASAYSTLIKFDGLVIDSVDELPDGSCVLRLRPQGRRTRRYVHVGAGDYGLFAIELREGCTLLHQIDAARFETLPKIGGAR